MAEKNSIVAVFNDVELRPAVCEILATSKRDSVSDQQKSSLTEEGDSSSHRDNSNMDCLLDAVELVDHFKKEVNRLREKMKKKQETNACKYLETLMRQYPQLLSFLEEEEVEFLESLERKPNREETNCNSSRRVMKDVASSSHARKVSNWSLTRGTSSSQHGKSTWQEVITANEEEQACLREKMEKKRKVGNDEKKQPDKAVELPRRFKEKIQELNGSEEKFVLQKNLFESDLDPNKGRLSIPPAKIANEFLRESEKLLLDERDENNRLVGIEVLVLDPSLRQCNIWFKKWPSRSGYSYYLTTKWNDTALNNNLQVHDTIQIWSFRSVHDHLCFALVKL